MGRALLTIGLVLAGIGGLVLIGERFGIPLGRLPGDLIYRGRNAVVYFPLTTSILASLVLTFIIWLLSRRG